MKCYSANVYLEYSDPVDLEEDQVQQILAKV